MNEKYQILVNHKGDHGPVGSNGNGGLDGVGGCQFKCIRSLFFKVTESCAYEFLVKVWLKWICWKFKVDIEDEWLYDLTKRCVPRQNGDTPSVKNSFSRELNNSPIDSTGNILLDYKIHQTQSGWSNFYQSFYDSLDKFSYIQNSKMTGERIIEALIDDYKSLDSYFEKFPQSIDFLPF